MKSKIQTVGFIILIIFSVQVLLLNIIPKGIAAILRIIGFYVSSENLLDKYLIGITVRCIGIVAGLFFLSKTGVLKRMSNKITFAIIYVSWIFYIYIAANLELDVIMIDQIPLVALMILNSFATGYFEEIIFRGISLYLLLKQWGGTKKGILMSVFLCSTLFGFSHLFNIFAGANPVNTAGQALYTAVLGIAFCALLLRTNWNLIWCGLLHALYNIMGSFDEFTPVTESGKDIATTSAGNLISANIINLVMFLPILVYGLFILRKVEPVTLSPIIVTVKKQPINGHFN